MPKKVKFSSLKLQVFILKFLYFRFGFKSPNFLWLKLDFGLLFFEKPSLKDEVMLAENKLKGLRV